MNMLKVPARLATQKGAGYLAEQAADRTLVITSHGKPVAVVQSPEAFDEQARVLRDSAARLTEGLASILAERSTFHTPEEAKAKLRARR